KVAQKHAQGEIEKRRLPLAEARARAFRPDWSAYTPPRPGFLGNRVFENFDLADLARFIDWSPFFQTWELKGRYPAILEDEKQGAAARQLWDDAQAMLTDILQKQWFRPKAVIGFWPANAVGEDIRLFTDDERSDELATLFTLRQQLSKSGDKPSMALADFVAPLDSGKPDYVGGFVVTAGIQQPE